MREPFREHCSAIRKWLASHEWSVPPPVCECGDGLLTWHYQDGSFAITLRITTGVFENTRPASLVRILDQLNLAGVLEDSPSAHTVVSTEAGGVIVRQDGRSVVNRGEPELGPRIARVETLHRFDRSGYCADCQRWRRDVYELVESSGEQWRCRESHGQGGCSRFSWFSGPNGGGPNYRPRY